jgi:hypothetical protein
MCVTEGYELNDSIYKIEDQNIQSSYIKDSEYNSSNTSFNQIENSKIIEESEKEVKPIVLSKNQMHEYEEMNQAEVLEDKFNLKQEKISGNKNKDLNKIKSKTILLTKQQHKLKKREKNNRFAESYNKENVTPTPSASDKGKEYIEDEESENYDTNHNNTYIHENQFNLINSNYAEVSDSSNMVNEVTSSLDNKLNEVALNNDYHEESVPMGYSNYNFNAFGLLREEIPSVKTATYSKSKNLDNQKCTTIKRAILDLNKSGFIGNNNVESSWNNTFKETCGNW